jgi:undecaprenyl-diphosphatase
VKRYLASITRRIRRAWLQELLILGALGGAFLVLLLFVDHSAPSAFDRSVAGAIQSIRWGELAFVPRLGSDLGGGVYGFYVAPAVAAVILTAMRRWRLLALLVAVFALHYLMISPKQLITAYRPSPLFGVEGGGGLESFPSGHVEWAVSFYGLLAYFAWRAASGHRRLIVVAAYALVVFGTMLGRIELGRHWPLDTLAGLIAGLIALRILIALHALSPDPRRFSEQPRRSVQARAVVVTPAQQADVGAYRSSA